MATIHRTTMVPTKLELLTNWLPKQPWFAGADAPELIRSGGFRLDDPEGEVGIEIQVVVDTAGPEPVPYLVAMGYRGAPLDGVPDEALIGTSEHGVLGTRWIYDGAQDPVVTAQLRALLRGQAEPQHQFESGTPDPTVAVQGDGGGPGVRLNRLLTPVSTAPPVSAHVVAGWTWPDGTAERGVFATAVPQ
jgi:hypothetical protein